MSLYVALMSVIGCGSFFDMVTAVNHHGMFGSLLRVRLVLSAPLPCRTSQFTPRERQEAAPRTGGAGASCRTGCNDRHLVSSQLACKTQRRHQKTAHGVAEETPRIGAKKLSLGPRCLSLPAGQCFDEQEVQDLANWVWVLFSAHLTSHHRPGCQLPRLFHQIIEKLHFGLLLAAVAARLFLGMDTCSATPTFPHLSLLPRVVVACFPVVSARLTVQQLASAALLVVALEFLLCSL